MMREDTADPYADSHAGDYDEFSILWRKIANGWYVHVVGQAKLIGPYATSQAAFGDMKDAIDLLIEMEI
jgi:hypothetical protein